MKYFLRLLIYIAIFFMVFSVTTVLLLRFVPVTVTPLKIIRVAQNFPEKGISVYSKWVNIERISPLMVRAVIATEDNNFFNHRGFDWNAIKLVWEENKKGNRIRGGSTISQQTAKNVFCLPSRTWFRKGVEAYYTMLIELLWGKKRIMEVYLNVIETGKNMYGVEATALRIYGKHASELNIYEASMIATVLPNPLRMNLAAPSNYMVRRAENVRRLMNMLGDTYFP